MQNTERDPYATPHPPKSKSGPMLRYVIVAALLAAAGVGYATMRDGPGLMDPPPEEQAALQQTTSLADASQAPGYPAAEAPVTAPTAAPAQRTPSRATAPAAEPAPEPVPPPTTTTIPNAAPAATPLPPEA